MDKIRKVAFCGRSLMMAGLEAGLRGRKGLETIWLDADLPDAIEQLGSLQPDVLVVDLSNPHSEYALTCLCEYPGIPVIGLDLTTNRATVISSQNYDTPTAPDLAKLLQREARKQSERMQQGEK
jgi:chemotaxis response regulator CheB